MDYKIEIPFGAHDSELKGWEYTIPEGMEAIIKDGKVIVREKESEDEKIRRQLINVCNDWLNGDYSAKPCLNDIKWLKNLLEKQRINTEGDFGRGYDCGYEACLNSHGAEWFEKQKEHGLFTKEDEYILNRIIEHLEDEGSHSEWVELLQDIRNLPYQKEQKSAEWSEDIIRKAVKEVGLTQYQIDWFKTNVFPPKQEWSEEDEERIQSILFSIGYCKDEYPNKKDYSKDIDWLKSLRPKPKKNNMITPNKEFFQWIYDRLVNVHNEDPNMDYMISFKRRIEELPVDAPSWKPTEEQMEAFETAERWYSDNMGCNPALYQLLCGLKKL